MFYNPPMQTLVIGDIHGCYDELQALLDKAGLVEGDAIVSLGDCVDRGPETPQVLKFFREHPGAQLLMGNHERKHIRASRHEIKLAHSQQISEIQFGDAYPDALAFMSSLPLYLDLPDALLVHGYFEPGIPCEQQNPSVLCGTMGGQKLLRTQHDRPWYEIYDGNKPILVGHENYTGTDQPFVHRDRVFGLDTSCVTGQALSGMLLPSFRLVSVPSRADYWMEMQRLYPRPAKQSQPRPIPSVWAVNDERALVKLIEKVSQASETIMQELQAEQNYADLRHRQQAHLFGNRAGSGPLPILLQLARLGRLDVELAQKVLRTPQALYAVIKKIEEAK